MRVSQERTLEGRLFQIAGAAERKPRAPNEMLQRVTDRRLVKTDRRVRHGVCHWTRFARNDDQKQQMNIAVKLEEA